MYRRRLPIDVDELRELQADEHHDLRLAGPRASRSPGTLVIALGCTRAARPHRRAGSARGAIFARRSSPRSARCSRCRTARRAPPASPRRCGTTRDTVGVDAQLSILVDPLSVFMILVVTGVSTLIHLYSVSYMDGRPGLRALLRLPELLRLLDAAARPGGQLPPADRRLGVRRRGVLPADLVLVPAHDRHARRASRRS